MNIWEKDAKLNEFFNKLVRKLGPEAVNPDIIYKHQFILKDISEDDFVRAKQTAESYIEKYPELGINLVKRRTDILNNDSPS